MDGGMTTSQEKMGYAMQKISHLLKTTNQSHIKYFMTLLCIAIVLFFIVVFT
jgi:hypothetical protein